MNGRLLIYDATGYTGRLVAERAVQIGLDATLAGRTTAAPANWPMNWASRRACSMSTMPAQCARH